MTSTAPERTRLRFPGVRRPKPLLPPETERQLTARQRQVLAALEELVVRGGLSELTMVEIANRVNCSLRTLYGISPSKDELGSIRLDISVKLYAGLPQAPSAVPLSPFLRSHQYVPMLPIPSPSSS